MMISSTPDLIASSTPYWISGLSTPGSISLGIDFVAGKNLVPKPAAGKTALRTFALITRHYRWPVGDARVAPTLANGLSDNIFNGRCRCGDSTAASAYPSVQCVQIAISTAH